jgi:hypothetical protein
MALPPEIPTRSRRHSTHYSATKKDRQDATTPRRHERRGRNSVERRRNGRAVTPSRAPPHAASRFEILAPWRLGDLSSGGVVLLRRRAHRHRDRRRTIKEHRRSSKRARRVGWAAFGARSRATGPARGWPSKHRSPPHASTRARIAPRVVKDRGWRPAWAYTPGFLRLARGLWSRWAGCGRLGRRGSRFPRRTMGRRLRPT